MTDHIVARLRAGGYHLTEKPLHLEAADEIERLRAENERLREALKLADAALSGANMNMKIVERKVRAALGEEKK